ncbi:MAG: AcrR family transcriptional regulator [Myxococcota bacterium]|jgi:AcrR family transcriptional regulator
MSPMTRFENLENAKQRRILDVAAAEFSANGYNGASLNRIVREAGMSKGAFYYYFEDKADLFVTVARDFDELVRGDLDLDPDHLTAETWWPTFDALISRAMATVAERPEWAGLGKAFHDIPQDQWFEGTIGAYVTDHLNEFSRRVSRGQELEVVRTDLPTSLLVEIWMGVNTVMDKWALNQWDAATDEERQVLMTYQFDMLKRMLLPNLIPPLTSDEEIL